MLGKLYKHEFRVIGRMAGLLLIIAAAVTGLGVVYLVSPLFHGIIDSTSRSGTAVNAVLGALLGFVGLLSYMGMLLGVSYGFMIYSGIRFYKSMYSDEGYLTHTLPVKETDVLIVKLVIAGFFSLIISIVLVLFVGFLFLLGTVQVTGESFGSLFSKLGELRNLVREFFPEGISRQLVGTGFFWLISIIITPFANICILFGSLTVGQCSWKNRGLMGVIVFVGVRMAMSMITGVANVAMNVIVINNVADSPEGITTAMMLSNSRYAVTMGIYLIFAIGLTLISNYIVKNRLNLE